MTQEFLLDLGVVPSVQSAITLYCDNSGTVANAKEPRSHKREKHGLHSTNPTNSHLDSESCCHASNTHSLYMLIKDLLGQDLCKRICKVVF